MSHEAASGRSGPTTDAAFQSEKQRRFLFAPPAALRLHPAGLRLGGDAFAAQNPTLAAAPAGIVPGHPTALRHGAKCARAGGHASCASGADGRAG